MRAPKPSRKVLEQRRKHWTNKLNQLGPIVEGTWVEVKHAKCKHVAHNLTFKIKGKTKCIYVPVDMAKEVKEWHKNYRQLKKIIREISKIDLAIIHAHVPVKKAVAKRKK